MFRLFLGRSAYLRFSIGMWREMFIELGHRSGGRHESGAFLLTPRRGDGRTISHVAYYDDLDADSLQGGITLRADAFAQLWDLCAADDSRVAGDIHTHPGANVCQSPIDRESPMIARRGYIALIVPDLSYKFVDPSRVGVHRYDGGGAWEAWSGQAAAHRLYVGRWP